MQGSAPSIIIGHTRGLETHYHVVVRQLTVSSENQSFPAVEYKQLKPIASLYRALCM